MYFDFQDLRPDVPRVEPAMSRREGVLLSVVLHGLLVGLLLFGPRLPFVREALESAQQAAEARRLALEQQQQEAQQRDARFVFVQPRLEMPAVPPPPRFEMSDRDRVARQTERNPNPATNPLPFSRGNTSDRVDAGPRPGDRPAESAQPDQVVASNDTAGRLPGGGDMAYDTGRGAPVARSDAAPGKGSGGSLREAINNLQRYTQGQTFDNPQGDTGAFGPAIQFDTKGVEFGPWIRRFIAQIKRNWFIPYAAMTMRGHVTLTFNVHKDGRITDLTVARPSGVDAFNNSAFNAMLGSNPTQALPPEYPADKAFFTVTFYYNEQPPQ
jgi:TonB family protein